MEEYLDYSVRELERHARIPLIVLKWDEDVFYSLALTMASEIERNNLLRQRTVLICPAGLSGQYIHFVRLVNQRRISLRDCWFIHPNEYLNSRDEWLGAEHPLSLRGFMEREVYQAIDPALLMPAEQRIFPDPRDPQAVSRLLRELGGADIAFDGIGLQGQLAFNEPSETLSAERFAACPARVVELTAPTRLAAALTSAGGAVECVPQKAVTLGMAELLSAKRLYLGLVQPWHRYAVRRAACGDVSAQFPATLLQRHPNARLLVSETAAQPVCSRPVAQPYLPAAELPEPAEPVYRRPKKRRPLAKVGGGGGGVC